MKTVIYFLLGGLLCLACENEPARPTDAYACSSGLTDTLSGFTNSETIHNFLEDVTSRGIPGMQLTVATEAGTWSTATGLTDIFNQVEMQTCHRTRVGSTVKIFTAVTCLLLQEEGRLDLDDPITDYLSTDDLTGFKNTDRITVRHLLHHASGLPNYITSAQFQTASLNELEKTWTRDELLEYARHKPADFDPGTDVAYSNTGYVLLGDIISVVAGKPFYEVFEEKIFLPLALQHTQFAATDPVPSDLVRGYVDLYARAELINATNYSGWDYFTADGGLISNPHDLARFSQALFTGDLLTPASLDEMLQFRTPSSTDPEGFPTEYGLGIFRIPTEFGEAYVHGGDAIGYFAFVAYFPDHRTSVTWAGNGNYGSIDELVQEKAATEELFARVLGD